MAKIRAGRVGEQLKKELSHIIQFEWKDPAVGFLTLTGVEVTNDLSQAKVYVSVLGDDAQKDATLKALNRGKGFLRSEIGKRMRLRQVPELIFQFDHSIEYGNRIEKLLDDIRQEDRS